MCLLTNAWMNKNKKKRRVELPNSKPWGFDLDEYEQNEDDGV